MGNYFRDGEPNWRRMEAMARRGWGRFAQGVESGEGWSNMGGNFRIGRMLASGDLRLVALYLIEQQPRHGYDLIKAIEEKSAGFYTPSPGIVYPALTFLEEAGYVTSQADGNKKLYTITEEGRAHLSDNREAIESTLSFLAKAGEQMNRFREFAKADWPFGGREEGQGPDFGNRPPHRGHGPGWGPRPDVDRDMAGVVPELNDARRALKEAIKTAKRGSEDQQRAAAEVLKRAAAEIAALGEDEVDI
ncbi:DNA-binding transcriptional regulator, PadR family [Devosia sp. YR412]|uniref:PadR family transcriptional regulator n=1 Tax=Devosia sp. YR412 TaxID=1881030 RepID=UPI0008D0B62D|nr:PadR family transcriptional regulator [Devosia sp. YR412]SEP62817.1 DNA-binding transcriptional regulator, PadR family [Devosia sp. YR412]